MTSALSRFVHFFSSSSREEPTKVPQPTYLKSFKHIVLTPWNLLLVCAPIAWGLQFSDPERFETAIFVTSFFAIVPIAERLNFATEELAVRWGETVGGFLCALLGNIVEIVVAGIALFKCELRLVQSSLIGSILSNLLLVLGTSFVVGAIYFKEQGFSLNAAQINSSLLFLGVCAIALPLVAYSYGSSLSNLSHLIMQSSRISSVCILALYLLGMNFQLRTHRTFVSENIPSSTAWKADGSTWFSSISQLKRQLRHERGTANPLTLLMRKLLHWDKSRPEITISAVEEGTQPAVVDTWIPDPVVSVSSLSSHSRTPSVELATLPPLRPASGLSTQGLLVPHSAENLSQRSQASEIPPKEDSEEPQVNAVSLYALLVAIAIMVYFTSETLVDSIERITSHNPAITKEFIGLVLLPIVGNAAEHFTAITVATKNKLTLSIGVAVGSAVQIACFAIPLIVIVAWIGDKPLTLLFDPLETAVTILAVILVNYVLQDGKANYLEGGILITLYALVVVYSINYAGIDLESNLFACG